MSLLEKSLPQNTVGLGLLPSSFLFLCLLVSSCRSQRFGILCGFNLSLFTPKDANSLSDPLVQIKEQHPFLPASPITLQSSGGQIPALVSTSAEPLCQLQTASCGGWPPKLSMVYELNSVSVGHSQHMGYYFAASVFVVKTELWGQIAWLQIWILSCRQMTQYFSAAASSVCMGINNVKVTS